MPFRPDEIIVHPDLESDYDSWANLASLGKQPAQAVWKSLRAAILRLRSDGQVGEVIPQSSIPAYFRGKYGVSNLYCIDLAAFHRCFYTIANRSIVMLDIVDHPGYDKWFPGRRSR